VSERKQKENPAADCRAGSSVTAEQSPPLSDQSIRVAMSHSRFDRIDWCTQFSRLQSATGMPTKNAGDAHEDKELEDELRL
jgi:hypothetical protein